MACSGYYKFGSEVKKQKGVDNPERFLGVNEGVNGVNGVNGGVPENNFAQQVSEQNLNPSNQTKQILNTIIKNAAKKEFDISSIISKLKTNKKSRKEQ